MYAFSKSFVDFRGVYQVEAYDMEFFGYDMIVRIDLKIIGPSDEVAYIADCTIIRKDGKSTHVTCLNERTKEGRYVFSCRTKSFRNGKKSENSVALV